MPAATPGRVTGLRRMQVILRRMVTLRSMRPISLRPRCSMTSNLQTLALDGARPVLVHYTDPFHALLFPGRAF
jgi:hypothetical protein